MPSPAEPHRPDRESQAAFEAGAGGDVPHANPALRQRVLYQQAFLFFVSSQQEIGFGIEHLVLALREQGAPLFAPRDELADAALDERGVVERQLAGYGTGQP